MDFDLASLIVVLESEATNCATPFNQGATMSAIHLLETTTSTPDLSVAGLTDFGPGRSKLFGNSDDKAIQVWNSAAKRGRRAVSRVKGRDFVSRYAAF